MNKYFLILWSLQVINNLTAQIELAQVSPTVFKLMFSQQIQLPQFQILVKSQISNYSVQPTKQILNKVYYLQIYYDITYTTAKDYMLVFNQPLQIANGTLSYTNFQLIPDAFTVNTMRGNLNIIITISLACICSCMSLMALQFLSFLQIQLLFQKKFNIISDFHDDASDVFLVNYPFSQQRKYSYFQAKNVLIVFALIFLSYLVGLIIKLVSKKIDNIIIKILKQIFTYKCFIIIFNIFSFSICFDALEFVYLIYHSPDSIEPFYYYIGIVLTYISFVLIATLITIYVVILNPKIRESTQQWEERKQSLQYTHYRAIVSDLDMSTITRRNYPLFLLIKKIVLVLLFCIPEIQIYLIVSLIFQISHLSFLYVDKPYISKFNQQLSTVLQSFIIIFYMVCTQYMLYFGMSQSLITEYEVGNFTIIKVTIIQLMLFLIIVCTIYSIYMKVKAVMQSKENNNEQEYKQHIRNRRETSISKNNRLSLSSASSYKDKTIGQGQIYQQDDCCSPKKKNRKKLFEVQLQDIGVKKKNSLSKEKEKSPRLTFNSKKKWNKQSLLEEIMNN